MHARCGHIQGSASLTDELSALLREFLALGQLHKSRRLHYQFGSCEELAVCLQALLPQPPLVFPEMCVAGADQTGEGRDDGDDDGRLGGGHALSVARGRW